MAKRLNYWWLKQYHDYYKDETIKWLSLQEHGNDYIVLYQKLCLLCVTKKTDVLRITIGQIDAPYTVSDFSKEFLMDTILIEKGLYILGKAGLIEQFDDGSWHLPKLLSMVGKGEDPRLLKRREQARLRKRRERERKKLGEAVSGTVLLEDPSETP